MIQEILCWLGQNWKLIIFSSIGAWILGGIFDLFMSLPQRFRVRKTIKYINERIDKSSLGRINFVPTNLIAETSQPREIVSEALNKLFKKRILKFDPNGEIYYYQKVTP